MDRSFDASTGRKAVTARSNLDSATRHTRRYTQSLDPKFKEKALFNINSTREYLDALERHLGQNS